MYICVYAEREQGTHQCTYTYRYLVKPAQSSLSAFLPAHTRDREPSTNERQPIHIPPCVSVSYPACLHHAPSPCVSGAGKSSWALERTRARKSG